MRITNWIGDTTEDGCPECLHSDGDTNVSMKPLLSAAFQEAFRIAICDSLDAKCERLVEIFRDIDVLTDEEWASISPEVLAKNAFNRMFGNGGFTVRGVYSGNASAREAFEACVANRDENRTDKFMGDWNNSEVGKQFPASPIDPGLLRDEEGLEEDG